MDFMDITFLTQYYGFDWLAILVGVIGLWRLGNKDKSGFIFYMLAAVAGFVFAVLAHSGAYMIANLITLLLQLRGYLKWQKEELTIVKII